MRCLGAQCCLGVNEIDLGDGTTIGRTVFSFCRLADYQCRWRTALQVFRASLSL
jgi:hypothetical protein